MENYDYYCTWQAQNILCLDRDVSNRDILDENFLFEIDKIASSYPSIRDKLYFILDDGWDVPYFNTHKKLNYPFGSFKIKKERFSFVNGKYPERLKQLSDRILSYGWKGIGLWVCTQGHGNSYFKDVKHLRSYFKTRMLWSKYANIKYWKVDWGKYDKDVSFRKMLAALNKKYYPELIIENAYPMSPVNGFLKGEEDNLKYRFPWNKNMKDVIDKTLKISTVFRSYDVTEELSTCSSIERIYYLLKQKNAFINVEDEIYLGAILGCPIGIQRNRLAALYLDLDKITGHFKENEVYAAINYRNYAPCFKGYNIKKSKQELLVSYQFGKYWTDEVTNHLLKQIAPFIIARNTNLVKVKSYKKLPFIVCCLNPTNYYSIGTFKQLNFEQDDLYKVNINVSLDKIVKGIAIFSNHINIISFRFKQSLNDYQLVLLNLINNQETIIKNNYKIEDNKLKIYYSKMTKDFKVDDYSCKAYLIKLIKNGEYYED